VSSSTATKKRRIASVKSTRQRPVRFPDRITNDSVVFYRKTTIEKPSKTKPTKELTLWRQLLPYGYSYKASCTGICNFWHPGTLTHWASDCPDVKNYNWRLNPVWHRMLYSCTRMATVGIKGLTVTSHDEVHHEKKKRLKIKSKHQKTVAVCRGRMPVNCFVMEKVVSSV